MEMDLECENRSGRPKENSLNENPERGKEREMRERRNRNKKEKEKASERITTPERLRNQSFSSSLLVSLSLHPCLRVYLYMCVYVCVCHYSLFLFGCRYSAS